MKGKGKELAMFPCPDLKSYPTAPKDQSHSELFDCPKCNSKMWLSERKKGAILFCASIGKDIMLACYPCMIEMVENDPALVLNAKQVNL